MAQMVVIIPVVERPHNAAPVVESIRAATPDGAVRILFVGNQGDTVEHEACRATGCDLMILERERLRGDYQRKINLAYRETLEPVLFLGADDLRFHPGWFEAVMTEVDAGFHVVGTNDLGNARVMRGEHATHCAVTRRYVDDFGTIDQPRAVLHEGYHHEYCDDELVGTAQFRGVWSFAADAIVEHLHPNWQKAPMDHLYQEQPFRMQASRNLYRHRRQLWAR